MKKSKIRYIIVSDTETGGPPNKDKRAFWDVALCEVAFVVVDCVEMRCIEEYSDIVLPFYKDGLEYNPQALAVNQLTIDIMKSKGVEVAEVYRKTRDLLKKYKNDKMGCVLCGHNFQSFDIPFYEGLFEFNKDSLWNYVSFVEDTMKLAYYRSIEQEDFKLSTCCRKEGVTLINAHRALDDTRANAQLMIQYLKYLRGSGGEEVSSAPVTAGRITSRFREKFQLV